MIIENTLVIFRNEFRQRSFFDWIISHTSGALPPHKYRGAIEITDKVIQFRGVDTKSNSDSEFLILKDSIEEVYYGYDEVFNTYQTRGFGLSWAPVRIKFTGTDGQENFAYFITGYERWGSVNKDLYNFLVERLS